MPQAKNIRKHSRILLCIYVGRGVRGYVASVGRFIVYRRIAILTIILDYYDVRPGLDGVARHLALGV
jgi:hypothetical protein